VNPSDFIFFALQSDLGKTSCPLVQADTMIFRSRSNPACRQLNGMLLERIKAAPEFMRQPHVGDLSLYDQANRLAEAAEFMGVIAAQSLDALIKIAPNFRPSNH
jgi:hypothetical protein